MKSIYAIALFICLISAFSLFEFAKAENNAANVLDNDENGQDKDRQLIDALIADLELDESTSDENDQDSESSELQAEKRMQYRYGRSMGYRYGKRSAMPYRFGKRSSNTNSWYLSNESKLMPESKMKLRRFIEFLKARDLEETKNKRLTYRYGR